MSRVPDAPHSQPGRTQAFDAHRFSAAFAVPGFGWLWTISLLSWLAWTLQSLAQGWLVLQLTDSPFWVGMAVGIRGLSQVVLAIPGGALADRLDRRTLVIASHALSAAVAATVAVLVLSGAIHTWHIMVFMALNGLLGALERPAINGLLYDVVGADRLLNASVFRFMGSSVIQITSGLLGGTLLSLFGAGQNFIVASLAYAVGIVCALRIAPTSVRARSPDSFVANLGAGLQYVRHAISVRNLLLLSVAIEGFGFAYLAMLPVMARDVLQIGGLGLGVLWATAGVGQLVAAFTTAFRTDPRNKASIIATAAVAFGICIVGFGLVHWLPLSFLLVATIHFIGTMYDIFIFTVLPVVASDAMRGRVLGLFTSTLGLNQLGGLLVGALAGLTGAPGAIMITGTLTVACAAALFRRARAIDEAMRDRLYGS